MEREHEVNAATVCRRAADAGHPIAPSLFSQYAARPAGERWGPPKRAVILGLAVGLDLSVEEVADAASRSAGIPIPHRMYIRGPQATEGAICTCAPTHSGELGQLVLVLPHMGLTFEEISPLVKDIEKGFTRLRDRRARIERRNGSAEAR